METGKYHVAFLSGGGNRIPYTLAAMQYFVIKMGIDFKKIICVSEGAIVGLITAVAYKFPELHLEAKHTILKLTTTDILGEKDGKLWSKLKVLYRITSKNYLYSDKNLRKTIKKHITKVRFDAYKADEDTPDCIVGMVSPFTKGKTQEQIEIYVNVKDLDYEDAIEAVMASTSIPPFVEAKEFPLGSGKVFYDCGLQSHIGSERFVKNHWEEIDEAYSIFTRPKELGDYDLKLPENSFFGFPWIDNLMEMVLPFLFFRISKDDELKTDTLLADKQINHIKVHPERVLTDSFYYMDEAQNKKLFDQGLEDAGLSLTVKK